MTVLYRLSAAARAIASRFGAAAGDDPWSGGSVTPGSFAPVITAGREEIAGPRRPGQPRRLVPRLWGVPPPPSAGQDGRGVLTVRNIGSPFWTGSLRNSEFRCLVPASNVMAWGRADPQTGKRRQSWLSCSDQPLFAFAGVWKDSEIPSFAILTIEANATWRDLGHETMPAILSPDPECWKTWLNGDWDRAAALLAPYPSSRIGLVL
ncbi:putative SOS response-associated peptidase YedK [Novosphingobium kunmingense]|uniref:Abasic site processing protein n=1 Tax=Novosphingobium kunmingense TaxID=1211806 RepID=A0A2N0HJL1_9SPHN|nr:SOS response-associated peptidase family protein [Novosphingobium kunmingense]PKB19131.1 putative SOS response-associated peptidase YedK [Novosphingobium kunmingense]